MNRFSLARAIKICIIFIGILGLIFFIGVVPNIGLDLLISLEQFSKCFYPWLFLIWALAIPCYYILVLGWKLTNSLEKDQPFTHKNGDVFKKMAYLGFGDSIFFICMNIVYLFIGMNHIAIVLISVGIGFILCILSICALIFSYLFHRAADLQEQSDFTI